MTADEVKKKIREIKYLPYKSYSIDCVLNGIDYKLHLLTSECRDNIELMELLGRWRKENEIWFDAIFKVTTEGTIKWFIEQLTEKEDRILFIIETEKGYIGHVGLNRFDFDQMVCEIDNIIRGEVPHKGIMQNAIAYMMDWGIKTLGIKGYEVQVASTNPPALNLYTKLGFSEIKRQPVIKVEKGDRIEMIHVDEAPEDEIVRYNIHMECRK